MEQGIIEDYLAQGKHKNIWKKGILADAHTQGIISGCLTQGLITQFCQKHNYSLS
jgi:hypothetical protein